MNTDSENILNNNFVLHIDYIFVKIRDHSPVGAYPPAGGWVSVIFLYEKNIIY